MLGGRVVSSAGHDFAVDAFDRHVEEVHQPHSNALHARLRGVGPYHVGPLARFSLAFDALAPIAREAAAAIGLAPPCRNPFRSIAVRAVEALHALDEAVRLIDDYQPPDAPAVPLVPRESTGFGVSEAPRGLLYHRYGFDPAGLVTDAAIVPPTSQNQASIERDLWDWVDTHLGLDDAQLGASCEHAVRNYDPCISCATHFLRLTVRREP
jgi:coenzyme F420-reducing hydrogenase alpha subunit